MQPRASASRTQITALPACHNNPLRPIARAQVVQVLTRDARDVMRHAGECSMGQVGFELFRVASSELSKTMHGYRACDRAGVRVQVAVDNNAVAQQHFQASRHAAAQLKAHHAIGGSMRKEIRMQRACVDAWRRMRCSHGSECCGHNGACDAGGRWCLRCRGGGLSVAVRAVEPELHGRHGGEGLHRAVIPGRQRRPVCGIAGGTRHLSLPKDMES